MTRPDDEDGEAALTARRRALEERLAARRAASPPEPTDAGRSMKGAADGMKLASEFVAGILAGAGIGYLLDRIAGTGPFGLIVFLLFGFVAGVLNVLRSVGKTPPAGAGVSPPPPDSGPGRGD